MKIIADKNILSVENGFGHYGELILLDGRKIQREDLLDADVLLVRSVTVVNESLLAGSKIKFVGTATSGTDHIDLQYLAENGIHFADAKGSNANAVVDYCFAALAHAVVKKKIRMENCEVGIIGGGKVGGLFASKLAAMNIRYHICDPPLAIQQIEQESGNKIQYSTLDEALQCDVVSLHVPLTNSGDFPTKNMLDAERLHLLKDRALLIHSCRGGVIDEFALRQFIRKGHEVSCVFDVWEGEPEVDERTVELVDIATPHIAGYSREAKSAATEQLRKAFQQHFDLSAIEASDAGTESIELAIDEQEDPENKHWRTLLAAFPVDQLSLGFKRAIANGEGRDAFDKIRQQLLSRREFKSMIIDVEGYSNEQKKFFSVLGFNFSE